MKQTVLVIGASGEIGRAIVNKLAQFPFQFILHYNQNKQAVEHLAENLDVDQVLMSVQSDLSQTTIDQMVVSIPFQVDIIIFAQGNASYGLFTESSLQTLDSLYNINVKSTAAISQAYLPGMLSRKRGHIIVITSIWGEIGASHEVMYSTVKGAQISFVKALAKEVGHSSVQVNAVSPGLIKTKMNKHLTSEELQDFLNEVPLGSTGTVDDVANAVSFLCNGDASYVHGQVLRINGGQLT